MQSLHSSVGSKSSSDGRILYLPDPNHHQHESIPTPCSAWIRRLCQKPPSSPSQLHSRGASLSSHPPAPALLPSACTFRSVDDDGDGKGNSNGKGDNPPLIIGHHNTISTVESCTRTSISNFQTDFFSHHLLDFHGGKSSVEESRLPLSFPSFGPFKVTCQSRHIHPPSPAVAGPSSPPSSLARLTPAGFDRQDLDCKEAAVDPASYLRRHRQAAAVNFDRIGSFGFDAKDSLTDFVNLNFSSYGNSHVEFGSSSRKRKEEEDKMKGGLQRQHGWLLEEHDCDFVNDNP